ncbi:family with sequence similarity 219 member A [Pitangus sulphuratus]|nr:family with sequence similarity 219 member A [Pitangus sulphuratus]
MDPTAAAISDRDCDTREGETVAMNYKPSPLQVKLGNKNILWRFINLIGNGAFLDLALTSQFREQFLMLLHNEIVLRRDKPVTLIFCPQGLPVSRITESQSDRMEKQRELARKGSLKNGNMGSPVNQQPKKNNVMARTRLVVPNKGYSSLDQSPDEKPLVALDTDSDDDFDMSRYSSSGYSSAEQINQDLNIQLLKDGYRLDEIPDDEDLDLIPPKSVNPTCMCCQATSSTACHIQ